MKLGYTIIYVADVPASVAFYSAAFGLTCRFQTPEGDYAEMDTGGATLSFARDDLAGSHGFTYAPNRADLPAAGIEICLICDDVPAAFDRATSAGGVVAAAPQVKPWGQTVAYLRDVNGVLVELATPMG
ncbi:MAG: VOC family protein [Cypionkella sp.]|nr:VOC family protein [Cypionkella sp.]